MNKHPDAFAIVDAIADPAILLSREYEILHANPAYESVYGDGLSLKKRRCYEVSHGNNVPCDQAGETCPLRQCIDTRQTARVLHVHHTPRGKEYVNVETWPVCDSEGDVTFFVEVLRPSDIASAEIHAPLVGHSQAFQTMLGLVDRVAPTDTAVLLLGESGTGKEIVARTIHDRSDRRTGPFVAVECTGLPESLFESELFGHEKGAFTGAANAKEGLVEAARGGTLFLDEVGDVSLSEQVKLLRLLETRQYRRVGSTESSIADFRLICATNKNLNQLVAAGQFREDLYYRLSVFEINLPPLRDRVGDVRPLSGALLKRINTPASLSPAALDIIENYPFPGNIRELRNVLERAAIMCDGDTILAEHLPRRLQEYTDKQRIAVEPANTVVDDTATATIRTLEEVETEYLRQSLRQHRGDRRSLAAALGISERALYRKLSRLRKT